MSDWRNTWVPATAACIILLATVVMALSSAAQSARQGWGSTPYADGGGTGVTFRVWAPSATTVAVAGQFNGFSTTATPLFSEGASGVWSVDVPGAVTKQEYKYFINGSLWKQDPRGRKEVSSIGNSIIYNMTNFNWAGDTFTYVPQNDAVVYELNIGSFNDPNPLDGNPGTFTTATNRLAYLKRLGISAVEVMPINEFPGNFSWGYNPSDVFGVESSFGGPDGFKSFVKTCHQLGIGVILDVEHNHYGPSDLDLWQFDGSSSGGYGGIYFYQTSGLCCTPFGNTRPNYGSQQVRDFIKDSFTMWLDEYHVDGFRWDSPGYMMNSDAGFITDAQTLIQQISTMIHTGYVGKINIGEDQAWLSGLSGFDSTWATYSFQGNVVPQLTTSSDSSRSMVAIDTAVNLNHNGAGSWGWGNVLYMESHDSAGDLNGGQRLPVQIDSGNPTGYFARKRSMLGSAITLTTPGIPMILQGEEMLTTNQFGASNALDWSRTNTFSNIVSLYTDLIRLRRNLDGRSSGLKGWNVSTMNRDDAAKLIAYHRWDTGAVGDDVVVVANFSAVTLSNYSINFPKTGTWFAQFNSDSTMYSSDYGNLGSSLVTASGGQATGTVNVGPYSVLIYSQVLPLPPPPPANLTATAVSTNRIDLVWHASFGATSYVVKREGNQIATTTTTNYSDVGLALGTMYCYAVAATNLGGGSADSAQACTTTVVATSATNLLAYWKLDEGSGGIAYDSSGNSSTGTVVGGTWTSGMIGSALYFDGTDQVTCSNSPSLNPETAMTVAAWIDPDGWSGNPRILQKGQSDNQYRLLFQSGQLKFDLFGVTNGTVVTSPPSAGTWHHVAGTYDGSLMGIYVDGQLVALQSASGPIAITTDALNIGNKPRSGNPFDHFSGIIDDVRIYGRALSAGEIGQLYQTDTVDDGVANWWRQRYFGDGSTTNALSCAICDADGTGQNNLFKYIAGLDPTDRASVFRILTVASEGNGLRLNWQTAGGHTNAVQATSNPGGSYSDISANIVVAGSGDTTTNYLDISATTNFPARFYRVRLVP